MKKINSIIAILAAAAGFVGCVKEQSKSDDNAVNSKFTVRAVTGDVTKTTLGNDCKVLWSQADGIQFVNNADNTKKYRFFLTDGEGTTEGTFQNYSNPTSGEYTVYYPIEFDGTNWPSQKYVSADDISGAPMIATAVLDAEQKTISDLVFTNVGSVLRYTVKGNKTLSYIRVHSADLDVTLDCGINGVALTSEGTVFNIAVPVGNYTDAMLTFKATDGTVARLKAAQFNVERNKAYLATFSDLNFVEDLSGAWFYKKGVNLYCLILDEDGVGKLTIPGTGTFDVTWNQTASAEGTINLSAYGTWPGTLELGNDGLKVVFPNSPLGPLNWTFTRVNPLFVGEWFGNIPGEGLCELTINDNGIATMVVTGITLTVGWQATSMTDATFFGKIFGADQTGTFKLDDDFDQLVFNGLGLTITFEKQAPEKFIGTWYGESSGSGAIRDNYTLVLNEDGTGTYSDVRIFEESDVFYYIKWTRTSDIEATIEFYESESAATPTKTGDLRSDGVLLRLYDGGELITYYSFYRDDPKKDFEHLGTWYSVSENGYTLVLNADYTGTYTYNENTTVVWTQIVKWNKFSAKGALLDFYESEQSVEPVKSGKVMMWAGGYMRLYTSDGDEKFFADTINQ